MYAVFSLKFQGWYIPSFWLNVSIKIADVAPGGKSSVIWSTLRSWDPLSVHSTGKVLINLLKFEFNTKFVSENENIGVIS